MRMLRGVAVACVSACAFGVVLPASAAADTRLVVGFDPRTPAGSEAATLAAAGAATGTTIAALDTRVVTVPDRVAARVMSRLRADRDVEYVGVDQVMRASWTPSDARFGEQWALRTSNVPRAWDVLRSASGTIVAVVDTGVDASHPDLRGAVLAGYDYVAGDANAADEHGHGTHVAGIIAAVTDNRTGVAGVAPGASILPVRVLDARGSGYTTNIARGIVYAADRGAKVINLSLGGGGAQVLADAIAYATGKGAVVTCASGNESRTTLSYPAAYPLCFAVGATTETDARASFSNRGTGLDITAPGTNILSTYRGGYQKMSGTSMATPMVSGAAALLAARGFSRTQIEAALTSSAKDLGARGYDTTFGAGRLDVAAALGAPATPAPTPPAPTPTPTPPAPTPPAPTPPAPTPTPPTPAPTPPAPAPTPPAPTPPAPNNNAPICATTSITLINVSTVTFSLRCFDLEGNTVRYSIAAQPTNGTVTLDAATGRVTYTARSGWLGADSFTYAGSDGNTSSSPTRVTVSVQRTAL